MTVATRVQPNIANPTHTGTVYKAAIDSAAKVDARIAAAFAPHEQSTPDMTIRLDAGHFFNGEASTEVAAQSTGAITAPVGSPRIDRIVVSRSTGAVSVITGTPAASPAAPTIPAGHCPVAQVLLQTTSTAITNSMLTDERDLSRMGLILGPGMADSGGTISPDINGLTADSIPDLSADYAMTWDASASALKKVLLSNIGGVTASEFLALQQDVLQNYLLDAVNGAWAAGQYSNGGYDAYNTDTIGVNSTNQTYDATNKLYSCGTLTTATTANTAVLGLQFGGYTVIDPTYALPNGKTITQLGVYSTVSATVTPSIWLNNGGLSYTYQTSQSFSHAGGGWQYFALTTSFIVPATGTYRIGLYSATNLPENTTSGAGSCHYVTSYVGPGTQTFGSGSGGPWITGYAYQTLTNMTLLSSALSPAPASAPMQVKLMVLWKDLSGSAVLNTDFTAEATRDSATWSAGTLSDTGLTLSGFKVLWAVVDVSAQPSGTTVKYRLKTLNTKSQQVKGIALMTK